MLRSSCCLVTGRFPMVAIFGIFRSVCTIHDNWQFVGYLRKSFFSKTVKFLMLCHLYKCRIRSIHPQREIYARKNMRKIHVKISQTKRTSHDQKVVS